MLPNSIVWDSPIQVRPVVIMQEVSIDSLKQQVHTFRGEVWQVLIFLQGGGAPPPHVENFYR